MCMYASGTTTVGVLFRCSGALGCQRTNFSISPLQPVQLGPSGLSEASQQALVLHLKRLLYGVAADVTVKISKPVQFGPQLEIPLGTLFSFLFPVLARAKDFLVARSVQKSWLPLPEILQSRRHTGSRGCFTTRAILQGAGTIRSMFSTRRRTAVAGKLGCTSRDRGERGRCEGSETLGRPQPFAASNPPSFKFVVRNTFP
jgi:hypothetical protein